MTSPFDAAVGIRDGGVGGRFPGEIHQGVAWWTGACLVVATEAECIAIAHDGHAISEAFHHRLRRGAVNAQHYACRVVDLDAAEERELLHTMKELGQVPGALVTTTSRGGVVSIRIFLYDQWGRVLEEEAGLGKIRRMIAEDRVPIPVNEKARGRVESHRPEGGER
ncbi:hypothetical protein [Streptomyces alboniger]|uniref:Uncharacterized protein n=1 Tax=Streptomyces alboniger TaxID=132473 RepID=A0A5J6HMY8_STRAD|nr:hypothetical protein [Streptomyces alboniger]QEV18385.1 hypothetical protein CP975_13570 [Streptomyces alboniger]